MSAAASSIRPALQCLRRPHQSVRKRRYFCSTALRSEEITLHSTQTSPALDPALVSTRKEERQLLRSGVQLIGSRRRRAALQSSQRIPFEQLPYQCFQEARKVLQTDREEKLKQIETERKRIARAEALDTAKSGGEASKKGKLIAMHKYLEELKVLADINDPVIKKRFEDGEGAVTWSFVYCGTTAYSKVGDMNRPIYRYLADRRWREYKRTLLLQRINQMSVVPDLLPHLDPTAEVNLGFGRRNVQPGEFVDSRISKAPARLNVQVFDKGKRLVTVAVIDSDVPNLQTDGFDYRCHFLAVNIPLSPSATSIALSKLPETQIVQSWLPPHAQKGSPYHRLSVFVLQQPEGKSLDVAALRECEKREGFNLRSFNDRHLIRPIGVHMFRSIWDEGTTGVMRRAGIEGSDVELKRKKPESLPYKKKDGARYR